MEREIWKDVVGFEGYYQVSNMGRVKGIDRMVNTCGGRLRPVKGKILKQTINTDSKYKGKYPHCIVSLWKDNKGCMRGVHVMVLEAFVGIRPVGFVCCHNDGNGLNNNLSNLRWGTPRENTHDSIKHGTFRPWNNKYKHEDNNRARFKNEDVIKIRELASMGVPRCKIEQMFNAKPGSLSRIITGKQWVFK